MYCGLLIIEFVQKYRDGKSYAHLVVGGAGGSLIGTTVAQGTD